MSALSASPLPNPYVAARSLPSLPASVIDNAPYLPSSSIDRALPPEALKVSLVSLLVELNRVASAAPVVSNLGVSGGWLYGPPSPSSSSPANWTVKTIKGGITNDLYLVSSPSFDRVEGRGVLVRLFGGEGVIDRDKETSTYAALCKEGIG